MTDATCSESFEVKTLSGIEAIVSRFSRSDALIGIDGNDLKELVGEAQDALAVTGTGEDSSSLAE
ncbi:MAG: hypothetical protein LBQ90_02590, partial [Synergistaceae bacterium]|nr:hypothetical protein [Synergistaceae bacterium]